MRCGTLYTKAVQVCLTAVDDQISGPISAEDLLCAVQVKASRYLEACCILDGVSSLEDRVSQELQEAVSGTKRPSPKTADIENSLRDIKLTSLAADVKPSPRQAAFSDTPDVAEQQSTLAGEFPHPQSDDCAIFLTHSPRRFCQSSIKA